MRSPADRARVARPAAAKAAPKPADAPAEAAPASNPLWNALAMRPVVQAKRAGAPFGDPREEEGDRAAEGDGPVEVRERATRPEDGIAVPDGFGAGLGAGRPLDGPTRAEMEERLGRDLSRVRVHEGREAAASAGSVGALAYTAGRHVVLGGEAATGSADGRRLLAHELTHVVQQGGGDGGGFVQRKASAVRFQDEPTLEEVSDGKRVLKPGDRGEAVIRLTIALQELGHYTHPVVDERYDGQVPEAVTRYQQAKGLASAPAGVVDRATFAALDADFSARHRVERGVLKGMRADDLMAGTQHLDAAEREAATRAISTEPRPDRGGTPPTFRPTLRRGKQTLSYATRLRQVMTAGIKARYQTVAAGKAAAAQKPDAFLEWKVLDAVAAQAQTAVHGVFAEYVRKPDGTLPPALRSGVNLFDAWTYKLAGETLGAPWQRHAAEQVTFGVLWGDDDVKALNEEHGAMPSRQPEKGIGEGIAEEMMRAFPRELLETHRAWSGFAVGRQVYVQRFRAPSPDAQRVAMWHYFRTFIHEYMHTLEHPAHERYRRGLDEQKGQRALREGTADYLANIVWDGLDFTPELRKAVEGDFHDKDRPVRIPEPARYPEAANAERLAGVVGVRNLAAAFFTGRLDLIGGPAPGVPSGRM